MRMYSRKIGGIPTSCASQNSLQSSHFNDSVQCAVSVRWTSRCAVASLIRLQPSIKLWYGSSGAFRPTPYSEHTYFGSVRLVSTMLSKDGFRSSSEGCLCDSTGRCSGARS